MFIQFRRLESAIREEEKLLKDKDAVAIDGRKRGRDSEDAGNLNGSDLIRDVEKLREMNVQQLRDEAVRRGIASTGSKKELLKRICEDCDNGEKGEEAEDETDGISNYILIGVIYIYFFVVLSRVICVWFLVHVYWRF